MTTTIPNIETYPKHFLRRDGTEVTLRPLVERIRSDCWSSSEGSLRENGTI